MPQASAKTLVSFGHLGLLPLLGKEEGLAELVSVQPFVQEVPTLIPTSDLKSFFRLLSFPCSFKLNTCKT